MTRRKSLFKQKDYVELAHQIGFMNAVDELKKDVIMRNRHFYLRAAARRLKCDVSSLWKMSKRFNITFPHFSDISSLTISDNEET